MICFLTDPTGNTKQVELPQAVEELRVPLHRSLHANMFQSDIAPSVPQVRCDVYKLVRPIEKSDASVVFYEWIRTE